MKIEKYKTKRMSGDFSRNRKLQKKNNMIKKKKKCNRQEILSLNCSSNVEQKKI